MLYNAIIKSQDDWSHFFAIQRKCIFRIIYEIVNGNFNLENYNYFQIILIVYICIYFLSGCHMATGFLRALSIWFQWLSALPEACELTITCPIGGPLNPASELVASATVTLNCIVWNSNISNVCWGD